MQTVNYIQIIFASQASLGAILLLKHPRYQGLVALLISVSCLMLFNLNEELKIFDSLPLITPAFVLLNGPLWYLFVRQLTQSNKAWCSHDWLHLIPAVLALIFSNSWPQTVILLGTISQLVYIFHAIKLVRKYHHQSMQQCSDAIEMQIKWVTHVMLAIVIISVVDLLRLNMQQVLPIMLANYSYLISQIIYLIIFIYLIYQAINQPLLFSAFEQQASTQPIHTKTKQPSDADNEQRKTQFSLINDYIHKHQLFLQPRLNIRSLSEQCGISEKEVSQAINQVDGLNFCDYINGLRIEKFKEVLKPKSNILQIAYECGFNSKSTFNAVFKKKTGLTPSQFQKAELREK